MSTNSIPLLAQKAIQNYLVGVGFSWDPVILRGVTADRKTLPAIICNCSVATQATEHMSGNWIAECEILVRENADDTTEDDHLSHFGDVANAIVTDSIKADLTAAYVGNLTVEAVHAVVLRVDIVERSWQSSITFKIQCYPQ